MHIVHDHFRIFCLFQPLVNDHFIVSHLIVLLTIELGVSCKFAYDLVQIITFILLLK